MDILNPEYVLCHIRVVPCACFDMLSVTNIYFEMLTVPVCLLFLEPEHRQSPESAAPEAADLMVPR